MVGLGETEDEVRALLRDLHAAGTGAATIGQYLQPTRRNLPVAEFIAPEQFERYREYGLSLGFKMVFSGPLVRSSYMADEVADGRATGSVLNLLMALLSAALLIFCFPRFNVVWFAPVALTPLLLALTRERGPGAASCSAGPPARSIGAVSVTGSRSCWRSTAIWVRASPGPCSRFFAWLRRCIWASSRCWRES